MENTENGYAILLIREIFVYPKRKQHDTIGEKDKGELLELLCSPYVQVSNQNWNAQC